MSAPPGDEDLVRLARESGRLLAGMGVRAGDARWIQRHAETIASLEVPGRRRSRPARWLYRLARRAVRMAR